VEDEEMKMKRGRGGGVSSRERVEKAVLVRC